MAQQDSFNRYDCLFFVWLVLALVFLIRKITVYQRFIQYIRAGNAEVSVIRILNLLSDCEEKLNIRARVELYKNARITSPVMVGFFRPGIILPIGELEDKELTYIFAHELVHYKQKDMFYKWLIQAAICIHWFNPFVYLLGKEVSRASELSCDETVISTLDDEERREYGDLLISFLRTQNHYGSSLASVTLTEGAEQLKERLGAIMKFRKKSKAVAAVSFMAAFLLFVGAYAAQENNSGIKKSASIIHESADILYYENGYPYIHDILTNNTDKTMIETEYCMLAYNENGSPLKLYWNFLDSSAESSYENLVRTDENILPNQTEDYRGGWSLYDGEQMENMLETGSDEADQVAYSLICLKQVVFEDGTVWKNPDYENWFKTYTGKETSVDELQNYYPHEYELEPNLYSNSEHMIGR